MKILITSAIVLTGCTSYNTPRTIDEIIPHNVAEREEWDGSKGQFPPGRINNRVIDYNGHGLGYNSYHVDEFHRKYYKENGISPH